MRDLAPNIAPVQVVAPAVLSATNTSAALDLQGFESAALVINTGAIAGSGDFTAKLQESDTTTGGDFTDVAAEHLVAHSRHRLLPIASSRSATSACAATCARSSPRILARPSLLVRSWLKAIRMWCRQLRGRDLTVKRSAEQRKAPCLPPLFAFGFKGARTVRASVSYSAWPHGADVTATRSTPSWCVPCL